VKVDGTVDGCVAKVPVTKRRRYVSATTPMNIFETMAFDGRGLGTCARTVVKPGILSPGFSSRTPSTHDSFYILRSSLSLDPAIC